MVAESGLVDRIRTELERYDSFVIKTHGSAMIQGLPDLIACVPITINDKRHGIYVGIEVKVPGKDATPIQHARIRQILRAGGIAFVCDNPKNAMPTIRHLLNTKFANDLKEPLDGGSDYLDDQGRTNLLNGGRPNPEQGPEVPAGGPASDFEVNPWLQ